MKALVDRLYEFTMPLAEEDDIDYIMSAKMFNDVDSLRSFARALAEEHSIKLPKWAE